MVGCRRKACRRKGGSIRALRAVRASHVESTTSGSSQATDGATDAKSVKGVGETLFGVKSQASTQTNPFASKPSTTSQANPFSSPKTTSKEPSTSPESNQAEDLPQTFAEKARISSTSTSMPSAPLEPWQEDPTPYPSYYIDADKEFLEPEPDAVPSNARLDTEDGSTSTAAEEKALFESAMDRTFQRFADTLNQNPEQVLRYEFAGQPLLYSKDDAVGKLLAPKPDSKVQTSSSKNRTSSLTRIPRCTSCGAARVFELQLTPHAITELEKDETGVDGMDWGTIIVAVCSADCMENGKGEGEVGYVEEWVGVQWEEIV